MGLRLHICSKVSASPVSTFSVGTDVVSIVDLGCAHWTAVMAVFVYVDGCGSSRIDLKSKHGM